MTDPDVYRRLAELERRLEALSAADRPVIGTGTAGRIAQWATGGQSLESSTLIKAGAGVLTLSSATTQTITFENSSYTPTMTGGTTAGVTTYTTQAGYYVRIGRLVLCYGSVTWTAATGTGETRISLPFTATGAGATHAWAASLRFANVTYANSPFQGLLIGATSYFRLEYATSNAGATAIPVEAAGTVIWAITYETD